LPHLVPVLLELAEVEWDHERYFREQASSHWLWKVMPHWQQPKPRAAIRSEFERYAAGPRQVELVRAPWFIR
jgi:hypothetical protein